MQQTWPDWRGQTACVIAAGASARDTVARMGTWRPPAIAVNRSHELAPWAAMLYAADGAFWHEYPSARKFAGLRVTASSQAARFYQGMRYVEVTAYGCDDPLFATVGSVGHGGHSGFQAVNLAAQFGATTIVLVGMDLTGEHWHPQHGENLLIAGGAALAYWASILDDAASAYAARGIRILNASPRSALRAYPKVDIGVMAELETA